MRILFVAPYWPNSANLISGIFLVHQANAFIEEGHEVTVVIPERLSRRDQTARVDSKTIGLNSKCRIVYISFFCIPDVKLFLGLSISINAKTLCKQILARMITNGDATSYDVVLLHELRYPTLCASGLRRVFSNASIISCVHGYDPLLDTSLTKLFFRRELSNASKSVDRFLAVGTQVVKYLKKDLNINAALCLNGFCSDGFSSHACSPNEESPKVKIVSVSNLLEWKGIQYNLRALAAIKKSHPELDWIYVIVGAGPFEKILVELSARLDLKGNVVFAGRRDHSFALKAISEADIFSLPSVREAFGIVYLEAMAQGKAVIGCRDNGAEDIIKHGVDGFLVTPGNVSELSTLLISLLRDSQLRLQVGSAAALTASSFSWAKNVKQIIGIANEVKTARARF